MDLLQQLFLPFESTQIALIPLEGLQQQDSLVWAATQNGLFTVRSAYHCIRDWEEQGVASSSESSSDVAWNRLWQLKIAPRYAHFVWRIIKGIVPTRQKLWNRGVRCPFSCPRCVQISESVEHVLRDCPWTRCVWFASPLGFTWPLEVEQSMSAWACSLHLSAPTEVAELFAVICYHIWKARNLLCFEEKGSSIQGVVGAAIGNLYEYQRLQQMSREKRELGSRDKPQQRWQVPVPGSITINVDAAGRNANRVAHELSRFSLAHDDNEWIGVTPHCIQ
ncbi:uncharacterized protein LOC130736864 [Lotus japonicus]|uniref:uncharacterized protein LOC130736864 n=1 Tax=Lotus japonicus TaxID=34305 RepID=UPI0025837137|nr:uncharacterized protein LOC130736864 [Lotus japonicus]